MTQSNKNIKAQFTIVQLGHLQVEGFLLPDGEFAMSQTQVFGWVDSTTDLNHAASRYTEITKSKVAKKLVPNGFFVHRKISVVGRSEKVNLVPLNEVTRFLTVALTMGYYECAEILAVLSGLALQQLFCDAFCIKFEQSDRQEWLKQRMVVKRSFRSSLTDALQRYGYIEPWQYGKFVHTMQEALGIKDGSRDELSVEELVVLESAQRYIGMAVDEFNLNPYDALRRYVAMM